MRVSYLGVERGAIARPCPFALPRLVCRQRVGILRDDAVRLGIGVRLVARDQPIGLGDAAIGVHVRKRQRRRLGRLVLEDGPLDGVAIEPSRRARLKAAERQTEQLL